MIKFACGFWPFPSSGGVALPFNFGRFARVPDSQGPGIDPDSDNVPRAAQLCDGAPPSEQLPFGHSPWCALALDRDGHSCVPGH